MGLEYSPEVKQVTSVFKEYRNDIDIYTEDKNEDKAFYVSLLGRLVSDTNITIHDIFPLGCKEDVIKACKTDRGKRRPSLYVVDGDIFLLYQKEEPIEKLFRLDAYCVENYVICEESVCQTAYELNGGRFSMDEIKSRINYFGVLKNSLPLIDLFFWYSIQSELFGKFELRHINAFFNMQSAVVDNGKISNRIEEIKEGLINHKYSEKVLESSLIKREEKFEKSIESLLKIVSGKDFLIPLFCNVINHSVCNISLPKEAWKYHLSKTCNLDKLGELKEVIISTCIAYQQKSTND